MRVIKNKMFIRVHLKIKIKRVKQMQSLNIIRIFFILLISSICILGQDLTGQIKWSYSAIVFKENNKAFAENRYGKIIMQGKADVDDADVIQKAVNSVAPAGELKIMQGKYILNKTIEINDNIKLTGEGRGTVLVPPLDDFAIKIKKSEKIKKFPRPHHVRQGYPLYAMIIHDLTIDGKRKNLLNSGMGISLNGFWSSSFMNLWIQNINNALTLNHVHESDFRNIYLIGTGNKKNKEAGVVINGCDNIHISGLYVIYQNYVGLEINLSKLVFITQSMFHGWLVQDNMIPAKYPLIQIKDSNIGTNNENRYKADVVIENSRITVGGKGTSAVSIINSPATIRQCVATCGFGTSIISVVKNSRVNVSDNSFYTYLPLPAGTYVFYGEDSEAIFKNNVISTRNLQVCLEGMRNSIIADNRFTTESKAPNVLIGSEGGQSSRNIQVRGNIFRKDKLEDAVKVEPNSKNIKVFDNQLWIK